MAPLACIYFAWLITKKDEVIQKSNDTLVVIVREQTTATIQNTAAVQGLSHLIESYNEKLENAEDERKRKR